MIRNLLALVWVSVCFAMPASGADEPRVTVSGMVVAPGALPFKEGMTLEEAIERAGGANEFGSLKRVIVSRDGSETRHDIRSEEGKMFRLQASDDVMVPQKILCGDQGSN